MLFSSISFWGWSCRTIWYQGFIYYIHRHRGWCKSFGRSTISFWSEGYSIVTCLFPNFPYVVLSLLTFFTLRPDKVDSSNLRSFLHKPKRHWSKHLYLLFIVFEVLIWRTDTRILLPTITFLCLLTKPISAIVKLKKSNDDVSHD